ncbi:TPA: hypothetical protein ENS27_09760 [bacterium]|nr:hypothetical protein [bacterium]
MSSSWIDGTPILREEAQNILQAIGEIDKPKLAPPIMADIIKPAYTLGDMKSFIATNMQTNRQYTLSATLSASDDRAYIFTEKGVNISEDKIQALLESFDITYNRLTNLFGSIPNKFNNDPRVHLLIMNIAGGSLPDGSRILGYFSPIDQFTNDQLKALTRLRSNETNMLYIDSISLKSNQVDINSIIAHEFAHLLQWGRDPKESIWVDEGLAVYAESLLGYNVKDRISVFAKNPDVSLRIWENKVENYGASYLFFAYISERFGGIDIIKEIFKNSDQDIAGIENALAKNGNNISFNDIFSDWVIANYLDNPRLADGRYGYATLDITLKPSTIETQYPIEQKSGIVLPWSAKYIEFQRDNNKDMTLYFLDKDQKDINARAIVDIDNNNISVFSVVSDNDPLKKSSISNGDLSIIVVVTSQPNPPDIIKNNSSYTYSAEIKASSISVSTLGNKITTWGSIKKDQP